MHVRPCASLPGAGLCGHRKFGFDLFLAFIRIRRRFEIRSLVTCHLALYKALPARLAFYILKTPVSPIITPRQDVSSPAQPSTSACAKQEGVKPSFHPVSAIVAVHLVTPNAFLQDRCPVGLESSTFDLGLYNAEVHAGEPNRTSGVRSVNTVLALLRLLGLQKRPLCHGTLDTRGPRNSRLSQEAWRRAPQHLRFALDWAGADAFIETVSRSAR